MLAHVAAAQDNPPRKATFGSFAVTRQTAMPAVLVEHGYLTFASEAARLVTPDFQQRAAVGIANGLRAWLEDGYSPH